MRAFLVTLALCTVAVAMWNVLPFGPRRARDVVASPTSVSYAVTPSGFTNYLIDGVPDPTLTLNRGETYLFNVAASGHPFFIKTLRVTGTASQYTQGVTNNGATNGTVTFVVPGDAPATLFYQCGNHDAMGGTLTIQDAVGVGDGSDPSTVWLARPTPNPVRRDAMFRFGLPRPARIDLALFDTRGRRVRALRSGAMPAGEHSVRWDGLDQAGRTAPNGVYFAKLRVEGREQTSRFVVVR